MRLIHKLMTAVRGGTRESLEVVVDANALRILDQEIIDCENDIQRAKQELTRVVAKKLRLQREIDILAKSVTEKEQRAVTALSNEQKDMALDIAQSIAKSEALLENQQQKLNKLNEFSSQLELSLKSALQQVENYRSELRMARATSSAQQASERLVSSGTGIANGLLEMKSTLGRIQHTQQRFADNLEAAMQVEQSISPNPSSNTTEKDAIDEVMARIATQATGKTECHA